MTVKQRYAVSFQVISEVNSLGDRILSQKLRDILSTYFGCIRNLLSLGVRTGEIREDIDLESAALLFFGMIESASNQWMLSEYAFDLEEKSRPMWDIFHRAIVRSGK